MNDYETEESEFENEDYEEENGKFGERYHRKRLNSEYDSDETTSDSDNDCKQEKSELELLREKNMKRRDGFIVSLMKDPEYAEITKVMVREQPKVNRVRKDPSFSVYRRIDIPFEKRRSSRLQKFPPEFFKEDLIDISDLSKKRKRSGDDDYFDLEEVVYRPKVSRSSNAAKAPTVPVEEITDAMIANIARKGTLKKYSDMGSSCHQCRQKTTDQKTYCRSDSCIGVRGQFCGVCLENRYGEDAAVVLKDPNWKCPVCRDICNCSFCRQKAGKRPTGILAPLAQQAGHKSVKDFLESLKGEGDYVHEDKIWQQFNNSNYLIGYSSDLKVAHMGRDVKHEIKYFLNLETLLKLVQKEENELESMIDLFSEPRNLLGFFEGSDKAIMDDGTYYYMNPFCEKQQFEEVLQNKLNELYINEKTKGLLLF